MSEKVMFISINSPTLTLKLAGKRYKAVNGVFNDLPPAAIADLEKQLEQPHIRSEVRRVDMEEAARRAKEIMAKRPNAAVRGVVTSGTQAAAILRDAKKEQETQHLTGLDNPINTSTIPQNSKPLEVTQVNTTPPAKSSLLSRTKRP